MKLDKENITFIHNVVKTAKIVDIEKIIIEPGRIRGADENCSVVLHHEQNVPDMSFGSIGLNRLDTFLSRYEIARTQDNFSIDVDVADDHQFVRSLTFKGKGTKIDYRCANPTTMNRVPKNIKDSMFVQVPLNGEAIRLLQKGHGAMDNPDVVTLLCKNDQVSFEMVDVNNDTFKHNISKEVTLLDGDDSSFAYRYPVKTLLALFRSNPTGYFEIGQSKGILKFPVSDLTVYVLPQV